MHVPLQHVVSTTLYDPSVRAMQDFSYELPGTQKTVLGIILGGGAGSRLYPLTKKRAKPAVPLGGNYRLIDIPISNCLHSNINKIYCLTQFNSASLNRHLALAYNTNVGSMTTKGFVEILAATQTPEKEMWFQGADCHTVCARSCCMRLCAAHAGVLMCLRICHSKHLCGMPISSPMLLSTICTAITCRHLNSSASCRHSRCGTAVHVAV